MPLRCRSIPLGGESHVMKLYLLGHPAATALFIGTLAVWAGTEVLHTLRNRRSYAAQHKRNIPFVW